MNEPQRTSTGSISEAIVAIPTLTQYGKLLGLCRRLLHEIEPRPSLSIRILILDNGGKLLEASEGRELAANNRVRIVIPPYNLGVAGSWNYFARTAGRCIISNDDVLFSQTSIHEFEDAANRNPDAVIIENDHPVGGFSTFLLNRPEKWMELGGFDELLNPAYFEDNDARIRLRLAGNPVRKVRLSNWHHDNSSTLNNSSEDYKRMHWCMYARNKAYYIKKWGGEPGNERYNQPFGK